MTDSFPSVDRLRNAFGVQAKKTISPVVDRLPAKLTCPWSQDHPNEPILNGDDAAAIRDGDGYLLVAAEGMLPKFVAQDPWFAGYCGIMVNASDIFVMGGRPLAVVDVLFADQDAHRDAVMDGMAAASETFRIPVVGGHTSHHHAGTLLSVAIVGRAQALITSFDARPGDILVYAVNLDGNYRGTSQNFDAATRAAPERLRDQFEILPRLAEAGYVKAGKDVSMAGLAGTLLMLCESSGCGAQLDLASIPKPATADLEGWMLAFPSFGVLLALPSASLAPVTDAFEAKGIRCAPVGRCTDTSAVELVGQDRTEVFWDWKKERLIGLGRPFPTGDRKE